MDDSGKKKAGDYLAAQTARLGWSPARLAEEADVDPQTVRDFLDGKRWPQTKTRSALERAVGIATGDLELAARGWFDNLAPAGDPVERAITESNQLSRADKAALLSSYFTMLDREQRGVS